MKSMNREDKLNECFRVAGSRYGFDSVTAKFEEFQDVKVRWQRSYRWAEFKVTDYIDDAPDKVFADLADSIFAKIAGQDRGYPESMKEWLLRPEFVEQRRPQYLQRYAFKTHAGGKHKDLGKSMDRLRAQGLVPDDLNAVVMWTEDRFLSKLAVGSVLMRTVFVSDTADSEEVPDEYLDYAIYSELCRMMAEFDPDRSDSGQTETMRDRYAGREAAEKWIDRFTAPPEGFDDEDDSIVWSDPDDGGQYA